MGVFALLISVLPWGSLAFTARTQELTSPVGDFWAAGVDGKIDYVRLTFPASLQPTTPFQTDFEVTGYQIQSIAHSAAAGNVTLTLVNGDVQDTAATPVVRFFPGRMLYANGSVVDGGQYEVNVIASDGAVPVLDVFNGQAMLRPYLDSDSKAHNNDTYLGRLFMSFSEPVDLTTAPLLKLGSAGAFCSKTTSGRVVEDGRSITSTAHISMLSNCHAATDTLSLPSTLQLNAAQLNLFLRQAFDAQSQAAVFRGAGAMYFLSDLNSGSTGTYGGGVTFDQARVVELTTNSTICTRGRNDGDECSNQEAIFNCSSGPPVLPRVVASSWDLDGDGQIDTIQVWTQQDRYDMTALYEAINGTLYGNSIGDGVSTFIKTLTPRTSVRIDTLVPNSTLSSWSLPGYTITGATYQRGLILLSVTELGINSSAIPGMLNYSGVLTSWTGNVLDANQIPVLDRSCPVIVSVKADANAADVTITFSEPVLGVTPASFTSVLGPSNNFSTSPFTLVTPSPTSTVAHLTAGALTYKNFGPARALRISGLSTIVQASGPPCPLQRRYVTLTPFDTIAPYILNVSTKDFNNNGRIDGLRVVFNEPVVDETVVASQFTVVGFSNLTFVVSALDDSTVDFTLNESAIVDTTSTPTFSSASPTLVDLSNNLLAAFSNSTHDGVGPYPVSLRTGNSYPGNLVGFDLDKIVITFSENPLSLLKTDFVITTPSITINNLSISSNVVTLNLVPTIRVAGSSPHVIFTKNGGKDSFNNLIPSFDLIAQDRIAPLCGLGGEAITVDRIPNGKVDRIILRCSELVTNFSTTSFTIENYTITNVSTGSAAACTPSTYFFCLLFDLQEHAGYETDVTPLISYTASPAVTDFAGNFLDTSTFPFSALDKIPPVLISISTKDLNGDGKIDTFRLLWSEYVEGDSFDTSYQSFTIANYSIFALAGTGTSQDLNASNVVPSTYDGGSTPLVSYNVAGGICDASVNCAASFSSNTIDGVFPIVLNAYTAGNCKLNSVQISMNENINLSSVNIASFSINGYSITGATLGGVFPFGFSLNVVNRTALSPDVITPNVTYNLPLTIADNGGNSMTNFSMITVDKLAPCMVLCAGHVGGSSIAVAFSEAVVNGAGANLNATNFLLVNTTNAVNATIRSNSTFYTVGVTVPFSESEINFVVGDNKVALQPINVRDANSNNAAASCYVFNDDFVPPTLVAVRTVNTGNSDSQLDRIELQFDEPVSDASFNILDWSVSDNYNIASNSTGAVANDKFIYLVLTPKSVPDTGATPQVTYTRPAVGGLADRNRNLFNSTAMNSTDAAPPILISFKATILSAAKGGNLAVATFSEPVFGPGPLNSSHFPYTNGNGGGASSVSQILGTNGSAVSMKLNALILSDFSLDSVVANVVDAAGNPSISTPTPVTKGDVIPPVVIGAFTKDLNVNGKIDHLTVVFDDSMLPGTFNASAFSLASYALSNLVINDTVVDFDVTELIALDGDATPAFSYNNSFLVSDLNGNFLSGFTQPAVDSVAPFLLDCSSRLPRRTTIDCLFSEPVSGGQADFVLGGPLVGVNVIGASVSSSLVTITLSRALILNDFKMNGTVDIKMNSSLMDLANNVGLPNQKILRNTDTSPPLVLDVSTQDRDCDGYIDAILVQFNEEIIDANVLIADFVIGGGLVISGKDTAMDRGLGADDDFIYLLVNKPAVADTDISGFNLSYTPGALTDLSENLALGFSSIVRDGAGVALVNATANVDSAEILLVFSAPFSVENNYSQFLLQNCSVVAATLPDKDGSDSKLLLSLSGSLKPRDFTIPATITPFVLDTLGNVACRQATPIRNPDKIAPTIVSVATDDADLDGRIDGFIFNCSEPIDEASLVASDFSVDGYTVTSVHGSSTASSFFTVSVAEKNSTDASVTPKVSYASGSLADRYGNKMVSFTNFQSVDQVGPAIISATGLGLVLKLVFSKPVYNTTNGTAFKLTNFAYSGGNSTTANVITSVVDAEGADSVLSFGMRREFTALDFTTATVAGEAAAIFDVRRNALRPAAVRITQGTAASVETETPGLTETETIAIGAGVGGGVLLILVAAITVVVCKKRGGCKKKPVAFDQTQIANEFDFGSSGTEMTQSSRGVARLEA